MECPLLPCTGEGVTLAIKVPQPMKSCPHNLEMRRVYLNIKEAPGYRKGAPAIPHKGGSPWQWR